MLPKPLTEGLGFSLLHTELTKHGILQFKLKKKSEFTVHELANVFFYFDFQMFAHFVLMLKGWHSLSFG
jgi:hypothetical protein